jgi:hypothetical protein
MTTTNKDFKVKNGIRVAEGGTFGGTVSASDPVNNSDLATKSYVDSLVSGATMEVGDTAPSSPNNGDLWFDTALNRVKVYYDEWIILATLDDAETIPQHIHDTSIDGNGLIVTTFVDSGTVGTPQAVGVDAGSASTTDWADTWSGGIAVDNFN